MRPRASTGFLRIPAGKKRVLLNVFFGLISLFFIADAFAGPAAVLENNLLVPLLRAAAKTCLTVTPIKKLRRDSIRRIARMSDEKFNKEYALVQPYLDKCECGVEFKPGLTKHEAVAIIDSLTKKKISLMMNCVPAPIVAYAFHKYVLGRRD